MRCNPVISVVIPVYNCSQYLKETIDSVLSQSYHFVEIITVDDGSTDDSKDILRSYGDKINLVSKTNGGVSSARNEGIKVATGDWIAFVDGDDIWHPKKLELQVSAINQFPDSILIYSEFIFWSANSEGQYSSPKEVFEEVLPINYSQDWMYHKQLLTNWVLTSTSLVLKSALSKSGLFNEELPVAEDWDLFIRLSHIGPFCKANAKLTLYRQLANSLTGSVKERDFASEVIETAIEEYGYKSPNGESLDKKEFRKRSFTRYFNFGIATSKQKLHKPAVIAFCKAIKYNPLNIKLWIFLVYQWLLMRVKKGN